MYLTTASYIPDSSFFIIDDSGDFCLYQSVLLYKLMDLRYSFREKLSIANEIIANNKNSVKYLFSPRDLDIVTMLLGHITLSIGNRLFLEKILSKNIICYVDQPNKNINEIMKIDKLIMLDNDVTYTFFYKWLTFDKCKEQKIKTLLSRKIYMPSPIEFNDKFDCQLHFHASFFLEKAKGNYKAAKNMEIFKFFASEFINVASFSLNNPLKTESLHMWGLYGQNGNGIVLKYSIDEIILLLVDNLVNQKKLYKVILFDKVKYVDNYNPGQAFDECLDQYGMGKKEAIDKFVYQHTITKSKVWEHEKELRFFRYSISENTNIFENFKGKIYLEDNELDHLMQITRDGINKEIPFIYPREIIFGWNINHEDLNEITNFFGDKISIIRLSSYINYKTNEFYFDT